MKRFGYALSSVLVIASVLFAPANPAAAYCGGLGSQPGVTLAGGQQTGSFQAVNAYVQGRNVDPVVSVSAAWNMLHDYNDFDDKSLAQGGWLRKPSMSTYYVFAEWAYPGIGGTDVQQVKSDSPTPSLSHTYLVEVLPNNAYQFSYDGVAWIDSLPNVGWWPNTVEYAGETHDRGDHFPGSSVAQVELWGLTYKQNESWYSANVTTRTQGFTDIPGLTRAAGNDLYIWDGRCTDAG